MVVLAVWKTGRKYAPRPNRPASTKPAAMINGRDMFEVGTLRLQPRNA
jgi:hypothetical protein